MVTNVRWVRLSESLERKAQKKPCEALISRFIDTSPSGRASCLLRRRALVISNQVQDNRKHLSSLGGHTSFSFSAEVSLRHSTGVSSGERRIERQGGRERERERGRGRGRGKERTRYLKEEGRKRIRPTGRALCARKGIMHVQQTTRQNERREMRELWR
jgi:hypothetical protein